MARRRDSFRLVPAAPVRSQQVRVWEEGSEWERPRRAMLSGREALWAARAEAVMTAPPRQREYGTASPRKGIVCPAAACPC